MVPTAAAGLVVTSAIADPEPCRSAFRHHSNWAWVVPPLMSSTRALTTRPAALGLSRGRFAVSPAVAVDVQADTGVVAIAVGACESTVNSHHGPHAPHRPPSKPCARQEYVPPSARSGGGIDVDSHVPGAAAAVAVEPI